MVECKWTTLSKIFTCGVGGLIIATAVFRFITLQISNIRNYILTVHYM